MANDLTAFTELVDRHGAEVMLLLRRLCRNSPDADDLFQEVAVRVWKNIGSRPRLRNPKAWLMTIAYHTFVDHAHRRREPPGELAEQIDESASADPVVRAAFNERLGLLERAVGGLSPPLREVIALHYAGGLSLREVANVLRISTGTVKSRLNSALEELRRRMP